MDEDDKTKYYINKYGNEYKSDMSILNAVIRCESKYNQNAKGDFKNGKYLAIGLGQYHEETWERHTKLSGLGGSRYIEEDQIKQLAWTFANGSEEMKEEWTSYRAIKNGGEYTFYSKQLQKTFTVKCKA